MTDAHGETAQPVGRCEWCGDDVWNDQPRLVHGAYVWHQECAVQVRERLGEATEFGGPT